METLIGIAAPFLDVVLAVGDRVSRLAEPNDYEYYPVRAGELRDELPGGKPSAATSKKRAGR